MAARVPARQIRTLSGAAMTNWQTEDGLLRYLFNIDIYLVLAIGTADVTVRGLLKARHSELIRAGKCVDEPPTLFPWHPADYFRFYGFVYSQRATQSGDRSVR